MKKTAAVFVIALAVLAGGYMLRSAPAAAQTHTEICQANYDTCAKGCDGATSCLNQCQKNKDDCNNQGQ